MERDNETFINEAAVSYASERISYEHKISKDVVIDLVQAYMSNKKIKVSIIFNDNGNHFYYLGYVTSLKDDIVLLDHHRIELKNIVKTELF